MVLRDVAASTTSEESRPHPITKHTAASADRAKDNARIRGFPRITPDARQDKGSKPMKL